MGYISIANNGVSNKNYQVIVKSSEGAIVTAKKGNIAKTFFTKKGLALIRKLDPGDWKITVTIGDWNAFENISITGDNDRKIISLYKSMIPQFNTQMLSYKIYDDNDNELNELTGTMGNWKIKILSHSNTYGGNIVFTNMHNQKVDVFVVGGGGDGTSTIGWHWGSSGGGGGYTRTQTGITIKENMKYSVTVGGSCGKSSFSASDGSVSLVAAPGNSGYHANSTHYGGNGGCGGGGGSSRYGESQAGKSGNGGTNGGNGTAGANGGWNDSGSGAWYNGYSKGGYGQISLNGPNGETGNTFEFGENGRKKYSSGGRGGSLHSGLSGTPGDGIREANSGAGGNGTTVDSPAERGFSGVVIIRNSRS